MPDCKTTMKRPELAACLHLHFPPAGACTLPVSARLASECSAPMRYAGVIGAATVLRSTNLCRLFIMLNLSLSLF